MEPLHNAKTACLSTIVMLRKILHDRHIDGGWLPGGRELAKTLGVSHATCCKALERLACEGFVRSYPKKGYYAVPEYLHCRKIGLILEEGGESPFVRSAPIVPNAMRYLNKQGFDVQILQHSHPEMLYESALFHGVEGILWLWPKPRDFSVINDMKKAGVIPLVVVAPECDTSCKDALQADCFILYGLSPAAKMLIDAVCSDGQRDILYAGSFEWAKRIGLLDAAKASGIDLAREMCFPEAADAPALISRRVSAGAATAIIIDTNPLYLHNVLSEIKELPRERQPQIYVPASVLPAGMLRRFSGLRIRSVSCGRDGDIGTAAAQMLVGNILHNQPIHNLELYPLT